MDDMCECFLGFTGPTCSIQVELELSDDLTERVSVGFGLHGEMKRLESSPDLQLQLLEVCARFCINSTEGRCGSPPFLGYDFLGLPSFEIGAMKVRRLLSCGMADFVWFVQANNQTFPFQNASDFLTWRDLFFTWQPGYVSETALLDFDFRYARMEIQTTLSMCIG